MTSVFEKGNYSLPLALILMLHKTASPTVPFLVAIKAHPWALHPLLPLSDFSSWQL